MSASQCIDLSFTVEDELTMERVDSLLEALRGCGPAMSVSRDARPSTVSFTVTATSVSAAMAKVWPLVAVMERKIGKMTVTQLAVMDEAAREADNEKPMLPELVTLAEIAKMAGVSPQRASQLSQRQTFPVMIAKTGNSPLFDKAAVERWIADWPRTVGRPPRKS
jgi:hypothetical protein